MDGETNGGVIARYYRHGEAFWRELIARQEHSGMGVRKFCVANGVAPSTFHKWRATLCELDAGSEVASVFTPEAMFIAVSETRGDLSGELRSARRSLRQAVASRVSAADSVVITSGGMRIEMSGAHADRIVRHLLGRMTGAGC